MVEHGTAHEDLLPAASLLVSSKGLAVAAALEQDWGGAQRGRNEGGGCEGLCTCSLTDSRVSVLAGL